MSVSSEVRRTLVKSPPELWAELSDPAALAKHLGELGEIRVVRTESERIVEWESSEASGKVEIEPSGWGTRVTLTATRQVPELEVAVAPEPVSESKSEPAPEAEATPTIRVPNAQAPEAAAEVEPEPDANANADADADAPPKPEPEPRRGFFARLFGRRRRAEAIEVQPEPTLEPSPPVEPQPTPEPPVSTAVEVEAKSRAEITEPDATDIDDISAELAAAEEVAAEQVTAVLTSVLDRLGAAHHRPFSRA